MPGTEGKTCLQTPGHELASCFSSAAPWPCRIAKKRPEYPLHPNPGFSLIYLLGFAPSQQQHIGLSWAAGCLPSSCQPSKIPGTNLGSNLARGKLFPLWPCLIDEVLSQLWRNALGEGGTLGGFLLSLTVLKVLIFLQCSASCWIHFLCVPCPCLGFIGCTAT